MVRFISTFKRTRLSVRPGLIEELFFFPRVLTSKRRHQTHLKYILETATALVFADCPSGFRCVTLLTPKTMHFPAGLRLPIGYVRLSKSVTTVYNGSCIVPRRSRGFYCIQIASLASPPWATNATQARAQALSYIYQDNSRLFVVALVRHMLHRVPQLPLPSADARYASLTGTTILAPFPLVCAATIDAFAPCTCSKFRR